MRLTINNLLKIFVAILVIVFVGPSLLAFFERPSGEESYQKHRKNVKHSNDGGPNIGLPPKHRRDAEADSNNQVQVEPVTIINM